MNRNGSIKRRNLLLGAAASTTVVIAMGSRMNQAAKAQSGEFRWRMVSRWDETFPDQLAAGQRLADRIAAMSQGRLMIEVLPPDAVVPFPETLKAVSDGTVEMSRSLAYDWRTQSPVLEFFFVVPYGFTQNEISAWLHYFGGQELWDAAYAPFGVKAFPAGSLGAQSFGWFRNEINTLNDLKGLRFRTTGVAADVMSKLGVRPVSMGLNEYFHGDNGAGIGASHQTGWTGLVAKLIQQFGEYEGQNQTPELIEKPMPAARYDHAEAGVAGAI